MTLENGGRQPGEEDPEEEYDEMTQIRETGS